MTKFDWILKLRNVLKVKLKKLYYITKIKILVELLWHILKEEEFLCLPLKSLQASTTGMSTWKRVPQICGAIQKSAQPWRGCAG